MAAATSKLTLVEFEAQYGHDDAGFELWFGTSVPQTPPTWVHGLLQKILMNLLEEAGFLAASEVETRINSEARPKPDVLGTKTKPTGEYPTQPLDVVVEIISKNDSYAYVKEKCRKYQEWGFGRIFLVDPSDRSVTEWTGTFTPVNDLFGIPCTRIWHELDRQYPPSGN